MPVASEDLSIHELKYTLRASCIQGTPREIRLGRRDLGRMLVIDRATGKRTHAAVMDLPSYMTPGDVVVLNNSKRIPGVLRGRTPMDGLVDIRFVDFHSDGSALCRIFPRHDVGEGSFIRTNGRNGVRIEELDVTRYHLSRVRSVGKDLRDQLREHGRIISGFFYDGHWSPEHVNPFYATEEGSVESPLAGLHFTPELVSRLRSIGVTVCFVTLHSVGSWLPFLEDSVADHEMWAEAYRVPAETADAVCSARMAGRRVLACGSTSLRALESSVDDSGRVIPREGRTKLYITPGYSFNAITSYFTNFHQYQTSMIVLDAAVAGAKVIKESYEEASRLGYTFFEFGDAVLML